MARSRTTFKPGRSGNPKGRPPGKPSLAPMIQKATSDGEALVNFMLGIFRDPRAKMAYRMEAAQWLSERGFGKAPQVVEHTGEDGEPIKVTLRWPDL